MASKRKLVSIGNYRIQDKLGSGTFAKVALATHMILDKKVALKIIRKSEITDPYMLKHLSREASLLCRLNHPNIVKLLEICRTNDIYCLVLEYVPGGTLFDHVQSCAPLHEDECRKLSRQLVSAIAYLHGERILHRDLKLENILLDPKGRLVLIDFGLSNNWFPGKKMLTHCGSAEYASPELFDKDVSYGSSVDVWSFGVILYTITLGRLPFQVRGENEEDTLPKLIKSISKGLVQEHQREMNKLSIDCRVLIMRCLDTNPDSRISIKAIAADPWMGHPGSWDLIPFLPEVDPLKIAGELKDRLKVKLSVEQIMAHVNVRKFSTTGGCFNILKLEGNAALKTKRPTSQLPVDESTQMPGSSETAGKSKTLERAKSTSIKDAGVVAKKKSAIVSTKTHDATNTTPKDRSRSQDSRAPPSWRRSFLNMTPTGKTAISRLKRVDGEENEGERKQKETTDSGILRFGQKAFGDISNTMRPLLRRNSKRGSKPKLAEKSQTKIIVDVKESLLPQADKKLKLQSTEKTLTPRRRPIR